MPAKSNFPNSGKVDASRADSSIFPDFFFDLAIAIAERVAAIVISVPIFASIIARIPLIGIRTGLRVILSVHFGAFAVSM